MKNLMNLIIKSLLIGLLIPAGCQSGNNPETLEIKGMVKSFDGCEIDYSSYGNGETVLVFVHGGLGCNKNVWDYQIPYFSPNYKVVALSLAGHGNSGSTRAEYTMEAFGKDVAAVVNELDLKKVILVGFSLGGLVTIEAALNLPDKVIGIIGVDCLGNFELHRSKEGIDKMMAPFYIKDPSEASRETIRTMFHEDVDSLFIEQVASSFGDVLPHVFFNEMYHWLEYQNEKILGSVKKLPIPILCVQNGDARIRPDINLKYNPNSRAYQLNDLKHFFIVSHPELVNPVIETAVNDIIIIHESEGYNLPIKR
jgi:pimeloyl-ACP methyl ester carboxylesterase